MTVEGIREQLMKFVRRAVVPFLKNPWFWGIVGVKLVASAMFASDVMTEGFVPFISLAALNPLSNPYDHFLAEGMVTAFPYSTVMLWMLLIPRLLLSWIIPLHTGLAGMGDIFLLHLPVLFADCIMYLVLCNWLLGHERKILLYYFASPILFYISYVHGQLDAIPTMILFGSLALLFGGRVKLAFVVLGCAIAAKFHIAAALPFYVVYLYVKRESLVRIAGYTFLSLTTYALLISFYVFSPGYQALVLSEGEQWRLFAFSLNFTGISTAFLLAPAAYCALFFRCASSKRMTQDLFILMLGIMFALLVIFVPPMPGWYFWSIPFLTYFYIKHKEAPLLNFWLLNGLYVVYMVVQKDSSFFQSFRVIAPALADHISVYDMLKNLRVNADIVANAVFTALQVALAMNVLWCYKVGVRDSLMYKDKRRPLMIGIGGDSGAGKTTLTEVLKKLCGAEHTVHVHGDDAHKWERGNENWQVFSHLNPQGNNLHTELEHAIALRRGQPIERVHYDHATGTFTNPQTITPQQVVMFEGLHPYYLKRMRDLFDLKIFVAPHEQLRRYWKIKRDVEERGYDVARVVAQMAARAKDAEQFIEPQREGSDIVVSFVPHDETSLTNIETKLPETVEVALKLTFENSLAVEPLLQALAHIKTLKVELVHTNIDQATLECYGQCTATEIQHAAISLVPNYQELIPGTPQWERGYNGLIQLFTLYVVSELFKWKGYESHHLT